MFDFVRNSKKFIQIVLALIILPFALWGVDSYVRSGGTDEVAKVGESSIASGEFQQALREQQDQLRTQLGANANQELLDSPDLRRSVLQDLINQRLLQLFAMESKLRVSDETLVNFIAAAPSLQENGKFSRERYQAMVAAQGLSTEMFEARVRQDLVMQQAAMAAANGVLPGRVPAERWMAAQLEEREIREAVVLTEQFTAGVKVDAAAIKRYYEENRQRFEKPEQVRVEYLVLNQEKLTDTAKVGEDEVKAFYQANEARYKTPEQRQASHILIRVDKKAADAEVKAAQEKAAQIHSQLQANPGDFAKLAKQHSQDPGSAANGGDLGYFGRGMMVKPFEEAVFSLKKGEMSEVVRSDFGFHLIKLTDIRAERIRSLDEVRGEVTAELQRQAGARRFAEAAEGFLNTVYEQADSLKPAAEKYGLAIQTSGWLAKGGQLEAPFTHPKLLQAIFAEDAVKNRRNTEAVDVGANTLVSARIIEHRPATIEPIETVSGLIEKVLIREAAMSKAVETGTARLEKLKKGEAVDLAWSTARSVSRMNAPNLSADAGNAVFGVVTKALPAYAGARVPGGYALYRIDKVRPFDGDAGEGAARSQALRQHYAQIVAQEEFVSWLSALRQRYPVTVNPAALERK